MLTFKSCFKKVLFSTFSNAIKDRTNDLKVVYQNLINTQGNMSWLSHKNGKTSSNFTQTLNLFILNTFKHFEAISEH